MKKIFEKRIFEDPNLDIVISPNKYPFSIGKNITQQIIWIKQWPRNLDWNKSNITEIVDLIDRTYPDMDYCILLNTPENRTIKSILHYHVMLKPMSEPDLHLQRLIVLHAGSSSEIVETQNLLSDSLSGSSISGYRDAIRLGSDLKQIYQLTDTMLTNFVYYVSSNCLSKKTSKGVTKGLGLSSLEYDTELENKLGFVLGEDDLNRIKEQLSDLSTSNAKYQSVFQSLKEQFQTEDLMTICESYLRLSDQKDLDIFFTQEQHREITKTLTEIYNKILDNCLSQMKSILKQILFYLTGDPHALIMCSTSRLIVFAMAKHLNGGSPQLQLNLPQVLSNIRIEEWSDGETRVWYDNYYLGSDTKI